ncbi:MAG: endolytic transglycosylase MltG [Oscillospiraceae bacterium]|nr:endolytic transglycosylase MltG [Oscillospiraceae bacterium]
MVIYMDKFSDDFSNKSYEDLLNEYAGDSLTSKVNSRREQPTASKSAKTDTGRDINSRSAQSSVPQRTAAENRRPAGNAKSSPSVTRTPSRNTANANNSSSPATKNHRLDLREIKSFDEEMQAKRNSLASNKNSGKITDTMEFQKGKVASKRQNKPVIEKPYSNSSPASRKKRTSKGKKSSSFGLSPAQKRNIVNALKVNKTVFIGLAVCFAVSIIISVFLLSCVNDVLAIGRDGETSVEVVLPNNADTKTAVSALKDAGLIKNKLFCTVFIKAMGYKEDNYLPGVYYFTENMGVEKMIKRFKTSSTRGALISITIPEGYTIDKIFERLEKNNICTASALYKTINEVDFSKEYKFIPSASSKKGAYHALEGYFFPATYEFEQGADPATVVRAFLNAFQQHWTDEYAERAEELGISVDDIIKIASIIEKEGANAKQFTQISSVIHNRLNKSGLYPLLECNSTKDYVTNTITARVQSKSDLNQYISNYNTYEHEGLPAGAICNPGQAAIEAALYPDVNQNYFFAHDNKKNIYLAETMEQHEANLRTIAQVNAQS